MKERVEYINIASLPEPVQVVKELPEFKLYTSSELEDVICCNVKDMEIEELQRPANKANIRGMLWELSATNYDNCLPIADPESFLYQRWLSRIKEFQKKALSLYFVENLKSKMLEEVEELMVMQVRISRWLSENHFSEIYKTEVSKARALTLRFLMGFQDSCQYSFTHNVEVTFLDEYQWLAKNFSASASGLYTMGNVFIRTGGDHMSSMNMVHVIVHELIHAACSGFSSSELNEATTELMTQSIVQEEFGKSNKTAYSNQIAWAKLLVAQYTTCRRLFEANIDSSNLSKLESDIEDSGKSFAYQVNTLKKICPV